jgi:hypothetical protein
VDPENKRSKVWNHFGLYPLDITVPVGIVVCRICHLGDSRVTFVLIGESGSTSKLVNHSSSAWGIDEGCVIVNRWGDGTVVFPAGAQARGRRQQRQGTPQIACLASALDPRTKKLVVPRSEYDAIWAAYY